MVTLCLQIIKHQNGKLSKNNRPVTEESKADKGSVFTDRDFDKFEEEHVF